MLSKFDSLNVVSLYFKIDSILKHVPNKLRMYMLPHIYNQLNQIVEVENGKY